MKRKIALALTALYLFPTQTLAASTCASNEFKSVFNDTCYSSFGQWMNDVWGWTLGILIALSTLMLSAAGFIYMTSGGHPDRIKLAKKMIIGVFSGIALIVLARVLLVTTIGVEPGKLNTDKYFNQSGGGGFGGAD